eukprot:TRINITY_DN1110_c2_g1_i2.p3 TRINITY_DN1110_c2_g1~~TRINITY_DN1110_c2_g1_i2.p3  ORF type:complete len:184 (+),score=67.94 TRINITY_DN1110_c2_g1_i2:72-554(+)
MPAAGSCFSDPKVWVLGAGAVAAVLYTLSAGQGPKSGGAGGDGKGDALLDGTDNKDKPDRTYTAEKLQRMLSGLLPPPAERPKKTKAEWEKHQDMSASYWVCIGGCLFEVAQFQDIHPGGTEIYYEYKYPKDATQGFLAIGHSDRALKELSTLFVGQLEG